jgi:SAM-dependent methyltransferase
MFAKYRLNRPYTPNGGHAFVSPIPAAIEQLRIKSPDQWRLIITENEKLLGPSDSQHQHIRDFGAGAFSVWASDVYFSASDGSDCNANGREYELLALDLGPDSGLYQDIVKRIIADDREMLRLIVQSIDINNNFFNNAFNYFNQAMTFLKKNGIAFPQAVLELGSGAKPYVALRWLLEGASRFVANDLGAVDGHYMKTFGRNLHRYLETVNPDFGGRLDRLLEGEPKFGLNGLEVWDRIAFEDIPIPGNAFDLITSVSVLEHVMEPDAVVRRMAELLKDGGHALHGVDLRDHQSFWDPLHFLTMSPGDYAKINTENRLRLSDWLALFDRHGFELIDQRYATLAADEIARGVPIAKAGNRYYESYDAVVPWVNEAMRAQFMPPYGSKELRDLSVTSILVLFRKRG